ncbi:peptidoglycan-binding protein [Methylobacterium radiotolerans]|uniref:peptidoglycan-binding protein n=1 Tax=Methylobacterium radiotolerans TaxID=31998 RepID=UPI000D5F7027|nr:MULTISPECIES: peptidoglycan-binding protein [Methylobacterium]MDE3748417.1 peptidoglycan-binding protein [Methylobacterium radiotolerans]PVY95092.1 lysozyme family protein [Methylobacterium organophilum]
MASFTDFQDGYERTWASLQIRPEKLATVRELAQQLAAGKLRYREIEARTGVPWWFVGLCHYRESAFDFDTYLGNGQTLGRRTTIVPKGRGPFTGPQAFVEGAVDALRLQGLIGVGDWSVARALYRLEGFNGYGYHGRGVNSPYLWGGSTAYGPPGARGGKFVRDHVFDPNVVDTQIGTAVILRSLIDIDATVALAAPRAVEAAVSREPDDELADSTLWVQQSLNRLGAAPPLVEDGRNGPRTMAAVAMFQERCGLDDSGLADARTIAAIQEALRPAPDRAVLARIQDLERQVAARAASPTQTAPLHSAPLQPAPMHPAVIAPAAPVPAAPPADAAARLDELLQALRRQIDGARLPTAQIRPGPPAARPAGTVLGPVNGALGQTIGQLLSGKKSAIGIVGAVVTQILSQVPAGTGLGQVLAQLTPAFGLSPYTMPIFIALTAWGVLGKFEKWNARAGQAA